MATLASDLIESTRRYLFSGQTEKYNRLSGAITASDTTFSMVYTLGAIQAGTIIEIDFEEILVLASNSSTQSVTDCVRGWNGSTAASHAANAVVTAAPKFSKARILEAINNELLDLSSGRNGLYQIKTVDITFNPVRYGYDLTGATDVIDIAEIRYRMPGPTRTWPLIRKWALQRNAETSGTFGDFPSGFGLILHEPAYPGFPIRVRYKAPFTTLTSPTDTVASTGLHPQAEDIPPIGAAIRLVAGREIKRSFDEAQGEPRRAEEVPPQAQLIGMRNLAALREARIQAEHQRLQRYYSYQFVG